MDHCLQNSCPSWIGFLSWRFPPTFQRQSGLLQRAAALHDSVIWGSQSGDSFRKGKSWFRLSVHILDKWPISRFLESAASTVGWACSSRPSSWLILFLPWMQRSEAPFQDIYLTSSSSVFCLMFALLLYLMLLRGVACIGEMNIFHWGIKLTERMWRSWNGKFVFFMSSDAHVFTDYLDSTEQGRRRKDSRNTPFCRIVSEPNLSYFRKPEAILGSRSSHREASDVVKWNDTTWFKWISTALNLCILSKAHPYSPLWCAYTVKDNWP